MDDGLQLETGGRNVGWSEKHYETQPSNKIDVSSNAYELTLKAVVTKASAGQTSGDNDLCFASYGGPPTLIPFHSIDN